MWRRKAASLTLYDVAKSTQQFANDLMFLLSVYDWHDLALTSHAWRVFVRHTASTSPTVRRLPEAVFVRYAELETERDTTGWMRQALMCGFHEYVLRRSHDWKDSVSLEKFMLRMYERGYSKLAWDVAVLYQYRFNSAPSAETIRRVLRHAKENDAKRFVFLFPNCMPPDPAERTELIHNLCDRKQFTLLDTVTRVCDLTTRDFNLPRYFAAQCFHGRIEIIQWLVTTFNLTSQHVKAYYDYDPPRSQPQEETVSQWLRDHFSTYDYR